MKVLHYCESFSPTSETFIYDYVTGLNEIGVQSHVLTHSRINARDRPFPHVHVVPYPDRWSPGRIYHRVRLRHATEASMVSFWPQVRGRMRRVIDMLEPDIIHAQFGTSGVIIAPVADALNIPLVSHFRGYDVSKILPSDLWEVEYRRLFQSASCLIGISNHVCRKVQALGADPAKIQMLHTGVHVERFTFDPPWLRFEEGDPVRCIFVGRMVEKKAPLKLLEAFAHALDICSQRDRRLHLTIAGDGPLLEASKRLVTALGIEPQVTFLGAVPNTRVQELMRTHHLHVKHCVTASDGDQEGQGVTFAEASAVGLPIVTTRHNGIPDVVLAGETGYLVEEGDVEAMGERIAHLATHPEHWEAMGTAGRRHVEDHFDVRKQTLKLKALYEAIV